MAKRRRRMHPSGKKVVSGGLSLGGVVSGQVVSGGVGFGGFDSLRFDDLGFDNLEKAVRLAHEAAEKLHKLDSSHELLRLRFLPKGKKEDDEETAKQHRIEMKKRFGGNGDRPWEDEADPYEECLVVLKNYASAVEKAIKEINQEINQEINILPGLRAQEQEKEQRQLQWQKNMQEKLDRQLGGNIPV